MTLLNNMKLLQELVDMKYLQHGININDYIKNLVNYNQ